MKLLLAFLILLLMPLRLMALPPQGPQTAVIELREARFHARPRDPQIDVALPDTWLQRGQGDRGPGHYHLPFDLAAAPQAMWALCLMRLSDVHEVRVNGWLVSGHPVQATGEFTEALSGGHPAMHWITLPPGLLSVGTNWIEITVHHTDRGGLSPVLLGPADALAPGYVLHEHLSVTLPVWLNVAGFALAVFMLVIWWRRRGETLLGAFGALWALLAVSAISHQITAPTLPRTLDWLVFVAQVIAVALLCWSALAISGRPHPVVTGVLQVSVTVLLLISVWGGLTDTLGEVRAWCYPMMMAGTLLVLPLPWPAIRRQPPHMQRGLAVMITLSVLAAMHDYACWRGLTSVMDLYWLPYVMPVALAVVASVMIRRLVGALHEVEQLNADLEQRVVERTEALQQANQAKTRFLATASHDLRQPVVTIGLLIDLLREQVPPALRPMTDRVGEAVSSMEDLLTGLLDLSRLEAGTVRPRPQVIALQPLFDAIASHEGEAARHKRIRLHFHPTPVSVVSDPVLLAQILRNLVSNAVRYTERGGVLVGARRRGGLISIEVWDTGCGIPATHQRTVFEEFVQLDPDRGGHPRPARGRTLDDGSGNGLGLGLSIVQRSAVLLGHRLLLRSRLDHGSCFSILVPRSTPLPTQPTAPEARPHPLQGLNLTVVEDEPAVQTALRARLEAWGATVQCHDGLTTLRRHLAQRPRGHSGIDVLITDHRLRGATGLDVVTAVRQYGGPVPTLVITGDTAPGDLALLAANGLHVLHKPFRADALLAAIQQVRRAGQA
jgi:signal transduction histidine kinase/ActR/RegA family two-component response regulator